MAKAEYKVDAIKDGVVIDHIAPGKALKVIEILGGSNNLGKGVVTVGMHLASKHLGSKDVVKLENKSLSADELNKIALVAPDATVNIIKGHNVAKKHNVTVPQVIDEVVSCTNQNCITRNQIMSTRFMVVAKKPLKIKCYFCEKIISHDEIIV